MRTASVTALAALGAVVLGLAAVTPAEAQVLSGLGATHVYGPAADQVAHQPSDAEVMAAWPAAAKAKNLAGSAVMHCLADTAGELSDCQIMLERSHAGFGQALLSLAPAYRLTHAAEGKRPDKTPVIISATWPAPETPVAWQVQPKHGDFMTTATPGAGRAGGEGHAVMNCLAAQMGALHDCEVVYQDPPGLGFGAMALRFQGYLQLKPATVGGKGVPSGVDIVWDFKKAGPRDVF